MTQPAPHLPQVGKYELLDELGHGGMATVYRAIDPRLERQVAVKVIHRHLRESTEVGRRFTAEARAVAKLRHPNIVEIYDVSDDDAAERYLVAELVGGGSLRAALTTRKWLPAEVAAVVGIELAAALGHAHERGVVHRDVKPENVLFGFTATALRLGQSTPPSSRDGPPAVQVKITDFGIAKMLDQQGVTSTGQVLGSPAYMAPEQIECGEVDERSDVFSLGVLLYECMVGHLPFEGKNPAQVLRRVLDGDFAPPDRERATVGSRWGAIVGRALAKNPADRYATMSALRDALCEELTALGVDDRDAEARDYFDDGASYAVTRRERLVARLIERGRRAHAADDVVAAAGHFNRALAFAPNDAHVLALVTGLARRRARRALAARAGAVVATAVALGAASWATATVLRRPRPPTTAAPASANAAIVADAPSLSGSSSASATASAASAPTTTPSTSRPTHVLATPTTAAPEVAKTRPVKFSFSPQSALVQIDNGRVESVFDFGTPRPMSLGSHTVRVFVDEKNHCCDPKTVALEVTPAEGGSNDPVPFTVSLPFRPAVIDSQGPVGTRIACSMYRVEGSANQRYNVPVKGSHDDQTCVLLRDGSEVARQPVHIEPGDTTKVFWNPSSGGAGR